MLRVNRRQLIVATLCFCLAVTPIASAQTSDQSQASQATADFKFTKVDLELLEQVNLLDRRFERDGLVLDDDATNNYLRKIGEILVPRDLNLEHVLGKF